MRLRNRSSCRQFRGMEVWTEKWDWQKEPVLQQGPFLTMLSIATSDLPHIGRKVEWIVWTEKC